MFDDPMTRKAKGFQMARQGDRIGKCLLAALSGRDMQLIKKRKFHELVFLGRDRSPDPAKGFLLDLKGRGLNQIGFDVDLAVRLKHSRVDHKVLICCQIGNIAFGHHR